MNLGTPTTFIRVSHLTFTKIEYHLLLMPHQLHPAFKSLDILVQFCHLTTILTMFI